MTTEKQPFEDVIKHLLKNRDFPASRVIVFGMFLLVFGIICQIQQGLGLVFFQKLLGCHIPSANCKLVVWVGAWIFGIPLLKELGDSKVRALGTTNPKPSVDTVDGKYPKEPRVGMFLKPW